MLLYGPLLLAHVRVGFPASEPEAGGPSQDLGELLLEGHHVIKEGFPRLVLGLAKGQVGVTLVPRASSVRVKVPGETKCPLGATLRASRSSSKGCQRSGPESGRVGYRRSQFTR